jgi:DNA polymerase-1
MIIDVQALVGDPSDNVPGVPGIGVKTAAELINHYKTLENLLNKVGEISLGDSPSGEIKLISSGAMGEITIKNKAKGLISIDGSGLITIKNDVASLRKILDDFFTEYQMHGHDLVGGVPAAPGPIVGGKALPMVMGTFPKTVESQTNLNSLLS